MPYVEQKITSGLNLKAAATDIRDDQLQQAKGCSFDVAGAISSDTGRKKLSTVTGEVRGVADGTISGTKSHFNKRGTDLYKDATLISGYAGGTGQISVVTYNDYAYVADGTVFKRYKTTLEGVGLAAPTVVLATPSVEGGYIDDGFYHWVYTWYNGVAESNFSPEKAFEITDGPRKATFTKPSDPPTGTTKVRLYRTDRVGAAFKDHTQALYFIGEVDINTDMVDNGALPTGAADGTEAGDLPGNATVTTQKTPVDSLPFDQADISPSATMQNNYPTGTDDVKMTNLGIFVDWTDHDPPPAGITHLTFLREQIFGIANNKIYFTKTGQAEHWSVFNQFVVGRQTGDTIRSIKALDGRLVVYTDSDVYVLEAIGTSFEDSRLEQTDSPVGLAAEWAVTDVALANGSLGHLFMANKGIYLFDGRGAVEVSFAIEPLFTDSSHPDYINAASISTAVMASAQDKVWLSYASGSSTTNDRTLFVDFESAEDPKIAVLPYGYTTLRRDGISNVVIGGDASGNLYEVGTGNSDGGSALTWELQTKDFTFGEATRLKSFSEVVLDADFGGVATTITVTTDLGLTASFTDSSTGRKRIRKYLPTTLKGRSASVKVSSSGTAARRLYAIGLNVQGADFV